MRLLICAGGTGGGVYPALAVLQALEAQLDDVLWVGGKGGMEADLIQRQNIPYAEIPAAGVHGVGLRTLPGNILKLLRGLFASRKILRQFKPDVLLFTGGYVAAPMAAAALFRKSVLYVPDIEPGLALKFLAGFASQIAVTAPPSFDYFRNKNKLVVTGYPTRGSLKAWNKDKAYQVFDLHNNKPVVMVFGGSKGARTINRAIVKILPELLERAQLIHITGKLDWDEVQAAKESLPANLAQDYHTYPYLHEEMGAAFTAANLVISRAGASSLGEFPLFGLPAILVPYPYAWRYQKVNAQYLVESGAADMIRDEDMDKQLKQQIFAYLDNPNLLGGKAEKMRELAQPNAAQNIANLILAMGNAPQQKGEKHD